MRELTAERKAHQRLAARAQGEDINSPKIFAGHVRAAPLRNDSDTLPINPLQAGTLVTPFPPAYP
jgi:hypothetical protein